MDQYQQAYQEALNRNCEDEKKWFDSKKELNETKQNLNEYVKSHSVEIMVPMGKKAFVRGKLKHTNEITISHGQSFFSDVSSIQAVEIINHRIKKCDERLGELKKERDLFMNKLELPAKEDAFSHEGKEIIEDYNEATELAWRKKHMDNVRRQKIREAEERKKEASQSGDVQSLLDNYEMIEELAEELDNMDVADDETLSKLINGELRIPESKSRIAHNLGPKINQEMESHPEENLNPPIKYHQEINNNDLIAQNNQEIIDLLKNYRSKIKEVLRNVQTDDERNLSLFLDLTELKDDIEDDIQMMNENEEYSTDEKDSDDETASIEMKPNKRKVRFSTSLEDVKIIESKPEESCDMFQSNTIQINFQHSSCKFSSDDIQSDNCTSIAHPADIYKKYQHCLKSLTPPLARKSILKKKDVSDTQLKLPAEKSIKKIFHSDSQVIGDVVEHKLDPDPAADIIHIMSKDDTPKKVSKFKQMRLKS